MKISYRGWVVVGKLDSVIPGLMPKRRKSPPMAEPIQLPLFPDQASLTRIRPERNECGPWCSSSYAIEKSSLIGLDGVIVGWHPRPEAGQR